MCTQRKLPCAKTVAASNSALGLQFLLLLATAFHFHSPDSLQFSSLAVCLRYFVSHFFNLFIYLPLFVSEIANRIMAESISKLRVLATRWRASDCQVV